MNRVFAGGILFFAVVSLVFAVSPPKPVTSKYFRSVAGGFGLEGEKHKIFYGVTLEVRAPIPDGAVADFLFENPANKDEPFRTTLVIKDNPKTISAKSPEFAGIENNRIYSYRVILYRDETRKEKLGEHSQKLAFSMPAEIFDTMFHPAPPTKT